MQRADDLLGHGAISGVSRLLLAEAVETRRELDELRRAMPDAEIVVCRLTAGLATMESRLRVREPGMNHAKFVARARELQQILDAAQLEHFTVVNDERSVTDVAHEVLRRAGWLASGADDAEPSLRSGITPSV